MYWIVTVLVVKGEEGEEGRDETFATTTLIFLNLLYSS